ncbi:MAG: HAD-IA family hydrolase [Candidatus Eisenbacteria bacterium]|uniref:HAD-IA family hydrolase n=1 Tax=Eiseniibacteriota bacterium TaxID=2212470 RepID=A0A956SBH4_UNCEI|nr:HAD-IA family hydrolase [Candidatus Eisenbacteria bacterium]MCB9462255.1 HAD-IA family hydrolase [Candidatus Eisenbacteria bacterium]
MIRALIFDLDNTLTDFMKMKEAAVVAGVEAMVDMGLPLTAEEARRRVFEIYDREGIEYQQVFDQLLSDLYGEVRPDVLAAGIVGYRRARESVLVLYPHVRMTLLELLRRGLQLAVLSDAPSLPAWQRLHQLALEHVFRPVITFDDTGERKPSPKPFLKALEMLGRSPEEVLMIGDWPERDMIGASGVGIRTVFARYGDTFGTTDSGADFEIDDIQQILGIVDRLNAVEKD